MINKIFDTLDNWRNLPAYQLERRADIFFAIYLKEIIKNRFGDEIDDTIIPEFPIRKGTIFPDIEKKTRNLSYKVDYLAFCKSSETLYLIELKTDQNSISPDQIQYLNKAKDANIKSLIDGILAIKDKTNSKIKYSYLLNELSKIGWVDLNTLVNTSTDFKNVKVIFITPIDEKKDIEVIDFDEIITILSAHTDVFTLRFIESLKNWKWNPNRMKSKGNS